MNVTEALRRTDQDIASARKQIEDLRELLKGLTAQRDGLERAVLRYKSDPVVLDEVSIESSESLPDWSSLPRTAAIEQAMALLPNPVSPIQVAAYITSRGQHDANAGNIGSTLQHLKKQGKVVSPSRGKWSLAPGGPVTEVAAASDCDSTVISHITSGPDQAADLAL